MKIERVPNITFIGSSKVGKTSLIKSVWNVNEEDFNQESSLLLYVHENVQGRGSIKYNIYELPYFSSTLMKDIDIWLNNESINPILKNTDILVIVLSANDKLINNKINLLYNAKQRVLKEDIKIIVTINQIDEIINIQEDGDHFSLQLNDIITLKEEESRTYKSFFLSNLIHNYDDIVLTCAKINWNCNSLKEIIIRYVVELYNDYLLNDSLPIITFIGKTGSGKSSTINELCKTSLPVDVSEACTKYPIVVKGSHNGVNFNVVDLPGISECIGANVDYSIFYKKYLKLADTIVYLTQADTRAYKQDQIFINFLISTNVIDATKNIVLGINKVDLLFKDKEHPKGIDLSSINDSNPLIQSKIDDYFDNVFRNVFANIPQISKESIVGYSVYQKWNINKLCSHIFNNNF